MDDSGIKGDNLINVNKLMFLLGNIDVDVWYVMVEVLYGGMKEVLMVIKGVIGIWSVILIGIWVDGDYMLMVRVEDDVGNVKYLVLLMVMVDI